MDPYSNAKFTNENHLSFRKKHNMVLTLNKSNTIDQTPTPTSFIRNCEEIGLFQDIQNVNPFDETFKNAVEGKKGESSINFLGKPAGDDLHTPHLFPEINEEVSAISEELIVRSEADTSLKLDTSCEPDERESQDPVQVILCMPNGTLLQLSTKPLETMPPKDSITLSPSVKPVPQTLVLTAGIESTLNQEIRSTIAPKPNDVKQKLKAFLGTPGKSPVDNQKTYRSRKSDSHKRPAESPDDKVDDEKRQKTLVRNREAAYRCREKKKKWVEDLGRRADQMSTMNKALVQEVNILKQEVVRLKRLLLAHSDCPVTLAANKYVKEIPEKLTLNIQKAADNTIMDLDSPSIVKRDEVLASVGPPSTPDERIITFSELVIDREVDIEESLEDKQDATLSTTATTVIQINPNVLKGNGFS